METATATITANPEPTDPHGLDGTAWTLSLPNAVELSGITDSEKSARAQIALHAGTYGVDADSIAWAE